MTIRLVCALFCGAALLAIVPAASVSAQGISVEVPGAGVRIGETRGRATTVKSSKSNSSDRNWRERRGWRDREVRSERRRCKTVTVQEETPRGVITRTRTQC